MPVENAYASVNMVLPIVGTCICSNCWDQFSGLFSSNIPMYITFSILLRDITQLSIATFFLFGFYVLNMIFIKVVKLVQRNELYCSEC